MASSGNCKADTPAVEAIPMVKSLLQADMSVVSGPKFMLFATDGQTDFCDDGDPDCPADAMTWQVQDLYNSGIGTLIMGDPFNGAPSLAFNANVLQNLANSGTGQGATLPTGNGSTSQMQVYYACNGQGTAAGSDAWTSLLHGSRSRGVGHHDDRDLRDDGGNGQGRSRRAAPTRAR